MVSKVNAIALGIAILLPLVVYYGVNSFFPPPDYADYVGDRPMPLDPGTNLTVNDAGAYQQARREHAQTLFWVAVPAGLLAIAAGAISGASGVGAGLILGGIATLTLGYANYWGALDDRFKFISLLAALAILIWLGYSRRLRRTNQP